MSLEQKNNFVKLKPLPPKGTIAVTAPASPPDEKKLQRGITYLEKLGYSIKVGKTCYTKESYLAGSDSLRAHELMDFFTDPTVDAIFCARGGFGSMGLLPLLDYDVIKNNRKLFVGFSDITALQWGIYAKTSIPTVSAGMVATDMGEETIDEDFESNFWELMESGNINLQLDYSSEFSGNIYGTGYSGTISVATKLLGSPYFPQINDGILVIEDVHEYRHKIDGLLQHFKLTGLFNNCKAILLGEFVPAEDEDDEDLLPVQDMYERIFSNLGIPIIPNVSYGHIRKKIPVPVGTSLCLSLGTKSYLKTQESIFES